MTRPADLNPTSLTNASGAQLNYWIDAVNKDLPKKVLVKTGTVDVRRQRLADYFNIDLSSLPPTPAIGPVPRDAEINNRQWEHLRSLGAEWAEKDKSGSEFRLVPETPSLSTRTSQCMYFSLALLPSIKSAIDQTLAGVTRTSSPSSSQQIDPSMDDETVQALMKSAADGDVHSLVTLFKLQAALTVRGHSNISPGNAPFSAIPTSSSINTSQTTATGSPSSESVPASSAVPTSSDSAILASGSLTIEALTKAEGLRDVIQQLENGDVARIRQLYGPQPGRKANPLWETIKLTVTRRERLGNELRNEFNGDKEKFFTFFTVPHDQQDTRKKRKTLQSGEKLRPLRLVVEAIVHRDKALQVESELPEYQDNGVFANELWERKWDGKNKWEIWRAIGKENY
ncbi:hypothetical protein R3P38DRAFT_3566952, partial [Favolaschia claudopus]